MAFKVCIISCGMITNAAHIPAYQQFSEDYEIVAVSDINEIVAKDTAERHGIPRYYTNAEKMLTEEKPDVVSVCVPNAFHKEYTMMALRHGANVLCEKPLAFHYSDAVEMFEYAKKSGKVLMACQSMRFTPDRLAAKKYIEDGGMDKIYYGELSRIRRRGIPYWGTFHMKKISGGGAFVDIGVHMLDALVWLMGNPAVKSVSGTTMENHKYEVGSLVGSGALSGEVHTKRPFDPDEMDVEDFSCGTITFENGAKVSFKVAWAANLPEASDIVLVSKKAGIDLPSGRLLFGENGESTLEMEKCPYDTPFFGHMYLTDNLRKVLKGEAAPIVTPEESINVTKIIEMFYLSAAQGKEVSAASFGE
ncbi:MAG: Gfo/Idh/MocA family oxidoreductase [Lachnospiraceae bacterium]|nr:Gfo/Idh/MocA family oxidoreductase [Lachnospiraceae bacterium]